MHIHPSTCLDGPVSGARDWWRLISPPEAGRPPDRLDTPPSEDDPQFRADLVARIRREIAEGVYGTEQQLQEALERMLKQLERGES